MICKSCKDRDHIGCRTPDCCRGDTGSPVRPRLGAAIIFGGDAARCVHVHTGPDGIAAIDALLRALCDQEDGTETVSVIAVLGSSRSAVADFDEFDIPAAAVEDVVALALGLNR